MRRGAVTPLVLVPALLACFAGLQPGAAQGANYTSNTGECLNLAGNLTACQGLPASGNLTACCAAVTAYNNASCLCNPTVVSVVNATSPQLFQLYSSLPLLGPLCPGLGTLKTTAAGNCPASFNQSGACGVPDWQLDGARIQAFLEVVNSNSLIQNYTQYREYLAQRISPNVTYLFESSGFFNGVRNFVDYFSILNRFLNNGYTGLNSFTIVPGTITINATSIDLLASVNATWYEGQAWQQESTGITNWHTNWANCSSILQDLVWGIDPTLAWFFERGRASDFEICTDIMDLCTGADQQYANVLDCVDFFSRLPTQTCSNANALQGNNTQCRWLHLQIIPFNPAMHCPHVGYNGGPDPTGDYRCCDGPSEASPVCPAVGFACDVVIDPLTTPQCEFGINAGGRLAATPGIAPAPAPGVAGLTSAARLPTPAELPAAGPAPAFGSRPVLDTMLAAASADGSP